MGRRRFTVLAAACLLAAGSPAALPSPAGEPSPVPGATWDAAGYEDRVLGFRVERPPPPWEHREWNGNWAGPLQAVVAFADPTGALLSVHARDAGDRTLEECAEDIARYLHLAVPAPGDVQPLEVSGEPGLSFPSTGDAQDDSRPYHAAVVVTRKEGVCYALAAFADGKERTPKLSRILLERFRLLPEGDFRRARPPLDVGGPGWRTRGGVAEHAFVGARIHLGPAWRLALDPRIPTGMALPSLNLESRFLGATLRIQAVALEGRTWEQVEAAAMAAFRALYIPPEKETRIRYAVAGGTATLSWWTARRRPGDGGERRRFVLCGTMRGQERLVILEIQHPRARDPRVPVAIADALERLRILDALERTALVQELSGRPDEQAFVGEGEFVRGGAWTSTAHRIVWRKPSPLWSFLPRGMMSEPGETLAVLQTEEDGTNARLAHVETLPSDTKGTVHQRVLEVFRVLFPGMSASKTVASSLGSRDSLRTDLQGSLDGIPLRVTLITTVPVSRTVYALVGVSRTEAPSVAALDAAIRGLRFQVDAIPGARRTPRGWEDPGHGFRVLVPPGPFRAEARPVEFAAAGGTVLEFESAGERLVVAAREWPLGEPELEAAAVERVLSILRPPGAAGKGHGAGEEVEGTLAGLPSRDRVLPGSPAIRIARMRVGGVLFVVGASSPAGGDAPPALSWFRFLE
ncbi:MAG: hypothetical protein L6R43_15775 [Planctomycetes bacterium]|nr:hypothetical protein [Planctomycetota bacterium]